MLLQSTDGGMEMPKYVDGYVLPVPKKNLQAYRRMSQQAGKIWKEYGALEYRETASEDLKNEWGVPFPKLMKLKPGELVVFSWVVFKSRKHRDQVNKKVMGDPRLASMGSKKMPFDVKRMVYGGFSLLVDL